MRPHHTLRLCALSLIWVGCAAAPPQTARSSEDRVLMSPPTTPTSPAPYSNTSRFAPRQVEYLGFAGEQQEVEIVTDPLGQGRLPELRHRRASLDVRGAPLTEVLSFIAHRGGVNIVTDPSLKGEVTMTVRDISLETMLLHVLQAQKLGYERRGRVLVIKPRAEL